MAIRDAIRLTADIGYTKVTVESDSKVAIQMCTDEEQSRSDLLPICEEIKGD
jgi:ribonuclease HI